MSAGNLVRIASDNIRKAVGLSWRRDPDRIMQVLNEIDVDVVALQEAVKRTGASHLVVIVGKLIARVDDPQI